MRLGKIPQMKGVPDPSAAAKNSMVQVGVTIRLVPVHEALLDVRVTLG